MDAVRPETLAVFTEWTAERYGGETALRHRDPDGDEGGDGDGGGGWATVTYAGLHERVRRTGRALIGLGVGPGERVAVLAETRPAWTYTHFGIMAAGAVLVPVYPSAGEEELAWVLSDA